jgi:hypothetical protein
MRDSLVMPATNRQIAQVVKRAGFSFGPTILAEASDADLPPALALALVEQESGFRNIFGCDQGPRETAPWCHQKVTRERVRALIDHVERGGISKGDGITQQTSIGFNRQAEAEGGAHRVEAQCRVGFRLLHALIARHGQRVGIGAYNGGEGNPNLAYADSVIARRTKWKERIKNAIKDSGGIAASDAAVHRDLKLTTPYTEGPDVKALQRAINARGRELPFTDARLRTDSEFGPHTARACSRVAFALGLSDPVCAEAKAGTVVQLTQQLVRDPSGLSADDRRRARDRKPILRRRYEAHQAGAKAAVKWARSKIGVHEKPGGSNWGHPVQDWITFTGYDEPVLWCGCFVAFAVVEKGGAQVPQRIRLGFDLHINDDAEAGKNGFARAVPASEARRGDIATFSFRHIALVAGPTKDGMIHTIDGNSSAADGSNNNGGEVAEHRRPVSLVSCVGRLRY